MGVAHHHPVHEELIRAAVDNLHQDYPHSDRELVRDLVSEAFVRISDRGRAPEFVGLLAERHVRDVLRRAADAQQP